MPKSSIFTYDLQTDVVISCLASRSGTKSDSYKIDYQVSYCNSVCVIFKKKMLIFEQLASFLRFVFYLLFYTFLS
jgi:hypothetical protein